MNRKWLYHKDCPQGKIFEPDEDPGEGWVDSPDLLKEAAGSESAAESPIEDGSEDERLALIALCEDKGLEIDRRWGIKKLRKALDQ